MVNWSVQRVEYGALRALLALPLLDAQQNRVGAEPSDERHNTGATERGGMTVWSGRLLISRRLCAYTC